MDCKSLFLFLKILIVIEPKLLPRTLPKHRFYFRDFSFIANYS